MLTPDKIERNMKKKRMSAAPVMISKSEIATESGRILETKGRDRSDSPQRKQDEKERPSRKYRNLEEPGKGVTSSRESGHKAPVAKNVFRGLGSRSREGGFKRREEGIRTSGRLTSSNVDQYREKQPDIRPSPDLQTQDQVIQNGVGESQNHRQEKQIKEETSLDSQEHEVFRNVSQISEECQIGMRETEETVGQSRKPRQKYTPPVYENEIQKRYPQEVQANRPPVKSPIQHKPKLDQARRRMAEHMRNTSIGMGGVREVETVERPVKSALELPGRMSNFRKGMNLRDIRRAFKNRKDTRMKSESRAEMVKNTLDEERKKMREEEMEMEREREINREREIKRQRERKRQIDSMRNKFKKERGTGQRHSIGDPEAQETRFKESRVPEEPKDHNESQTRKQIEQDRQAAKKAQLRDFRDIDSIQRAGTQVTGYESRNIFESQLLNNSELPKFNTNGGYMKLGGSMEPQMVGEQIERQRLYQSGTGETILKERINERIQETQRNLKSRMETLKRESLEGEVSGFEEIREQEGFSEDRSEEQKDIDIRNTTHQEISEEIGYSATRQPADLDRFKERPRRPAATKNKQSGPSTRKGNKSRPKYKNRNNTNTKPKHKAKTNPGKGHKNKKFKTEGHHNPPRTKFSKKKPPRVKQTHSSRNRDVSHDVNIKNDLGPTPEGGQTRNRLFTSQPIVMNNNFVNYNYYINDIRRPNEGDPPVQGPRKPGQGDEKKQFFEKYGKEFGVEVKGEIDAEDIRRKQEETKRRKQEIMQKKAVEGGKVNEEVLKMRMREMKAGKKDIEKELGLKQKVGQKRDRPGEQVKQRSKNREKTERQGKQSQTSRRDREKTKHKEKEKEKEKNKESKKTAKREKIFSKEKLFSTEKSWTRDARREATEDPKRTNKAKKKVRRRAKKKETGSLSLQMSQRRAKRGEKKEGHKVWEILEEMERGVLKERTGGKEKRGRLPGGESGSTKGKAEQKGLARNDSKQNPKEKPKKKKLIMFTELRGKTHHDEAISEDTYRANFPNIQFILTKFPYI